MLSDKPICNVDQDRLNRRILVDEIASEIDSLGKDCAIIGICGKWGTGKSSVLLRKPNIDLRFMRERALLRFY